MSSNTAAIGIIDSGVGGLSIAQAIHDHLPHENLIYLADNYYAPYGDKSTDFIQQRINVIAQNFIDKGCKAIVIACNTATVNAIDQLRAQFKEQLKGQTKLPIIGVEPAIKPATEQSKNKKVGLLVTQATSVNERFLKLIKDHQNGSEVFIQPCPGLVELIEQGQLHSNACQQLLQQYITPLINQNIDTLVLGCTHYPFLKQQILALTGDSIRLLETAKPVALQLAKRLAKKNLLADDSQQAQIDFYSSKCTSQYQQLFKQLFDLKSKTAIKLQCFDQNQKTV